MIKRENIMNQLRKIGILIVTGSCVVTVRSQQVLTIEECYRLAKTNYPLVKQAALIDKTKEYSLDNLAKGYLPQITVGGQATYQSDITAIPISLPNVHIPSLSKDQYKIYTEVNQSLTDGFTIKQQQAAAQANTAIEAQKLEVELYKLKERINQIYFGILLIDAQIQQTELVQKDIESGMEKIRAAIVNGTAFESNLDILKVELLKNKQRNIELKANRKAYTDMLGYFINKPLTEQTSLQAPVKPLVVLNNNNRPELKLFDVQRNSFDIQSRLVNTKNIPRLGLFVQGGYGRPALNLLNNDFTFYYIGGLRLNWNISGLYTFKKEKQLFALNQSLLDAQKETFLFNTNISLTQQQSEINKYTDLVNADREIIMLREKLKTASAKQLQNGTITTHDYVTYINAEDQAKQNLALHQIQLFLAQYTYQTIAGN